MPHSFVPYMSKYSRVIDTGSKEQVDNYVRIGWKLLETYTELHAGLGKGQTIVMYRIGWPIDVGEPIEPNDKGDQLQWEPGPTVN